MSKSKLLQEIDDLINGHGKKGGVLVVTDNCPPGHYRIGEKIITAAELEQIRKEFDKVVMFTSKKTSNE